MKGESYEKKVVGVVLTEAKPAPNTRAVTQLSGITFKEVTQDKVYFTVNPMTLQDSEYIRVEYSNNPAFDDTLKDSFVKTASKMYRGDYDYSWAQDENGEEEVYYAYDNEDATFSADLGYFLPGETVYVRARVYNSKFELAQGETAAAKFSGYVTYNYKVPSAEMGVVDTVVTSGSITLDPSLASGKATGFQFQKYVNKKWMDLGKQSGYNSYKDSGLSADTKYTYRVRAYSYSKLTGKTVYTGWQKVSAYTWGASLNVKAAAASSTSVKLTWNKINKADGYEIYRCDTKSDGYTRSADEYTDSFSNMTLVKTIKKAKTVKYTDKKLTAGEGYTYIVRAYRTVNKTRSYIEGSAYILLSSDSSMGVYADYYTSTGKKTVKWDKMTGIKGYKVEKFDPVSKTYKSYKTLKKTATSYTFSKATAGSETVEYRIYPYTSSKSLRDAAYTVYVEPRLAAVKNVKATATSEGIKVTWSPVAGADYYEVYRCSSDAYSYDKTTKTYDINEGVLVQSVTLDTADVLNIIPYNSESVTTEDENGNPKQAVEYYYTGMNEYNLPRVNGVLQTETTTLVEGPTAGNTYYYVVKAVAKPKSGAAGQNGYTYSAGYTKPASAMYTAKNVKKATSVKATSKKKAQVTISFKKASKAKGYFIYRSTKKNGTYSLVGSTTKTSYTDKTVTAGKTYYYKVVSYTTSETGNYVYSGMTSAKKVKVKK